ncbi:unnamed protein product, partial [Meganyctiphanes norvegica]
WLCCSTLCRCVASYQTSKNTISGTMPILGNCCLCLDLKVGTTIIGVICLISSIMNTLTWGITSVMVGFIRASTEASDIDRELSQMDKDLSDLDKTLTKLNEFDFSSFGDDDDDYADAGDVLAANVDDMQQLVKYFSAAMGSVAYICYFLFAYSLLLLIVASMLIHGIKRNRRALLTPWIALEILKTLIVLIGAITLFALFPGN